MDIFTFPRGPLDGQALWQALSCSPKRGRRRVVAESASTPRSPAQVRQFVFPPQKYLFPEGETENTLIDVPYTLVRPGPCVECHRVGGCDAAGQGCRTKALLPYRATCHGLAAEIDNTRS